MALQGPGQQGPFLLLCPRPPDCALSLPPSLTLGDDYARCPGLLQVQVAAALHQLPWSSSDSSPATSTTWYAHPLVSPSCFLLCETEHPNPKLLFVFGSDLLGPPLIYLGQYSSHFWQKRKSSQILYSPP